MTDSKDRKDTRDFALLAIGAMFSLAMQSIIQGLDAYFPIKNGYQWILFGIILLGGVFYFWNRHVVHG